MLDSRRVGAAALLLLPAALMTYFAFNAGGFAPGAPAYAAMLLCVVLLLRSVTAGNPFEGFGGAAGVAVTMLALFTVLTLLSEAWSHAPGRAFVEFGRTLLYLLVLVLFGSIAHSRERLVRMLRSVAVGVVAVCGCALITRVLPHVWPTAPEIATNRLSFPVTYWNALGLLASLGIVLCAHFSSDRDEPPAARVMASAAIPILATTMFFTFSRGAIAVCLIALVTYALLGRPRLLLSALLATVPATAVALAFAYDAGLLATPTPTTAAAVIQGHRVAIAVAASSLAAAVLRALLVRWLDGRLERVVALVHLPRRALRMVWASAAVAAATVAVAFNGTIAHEYHRFLSANAPGTAADLRTRLIDPGNNGRIDMWRVGWHQFTLAPLLGHGAGTFQNTWAAHRPTGDFVLDAHSLYVETLDELGIVGFLLLAGVILIVLVRAAARIHGPSRPLFAAVFALLLAWGIHTGVDWDWEMPVLTVLFFALGGFVISRPLERRGVGVETQPPARHAAAPYTRTLVGLGCLLLGAAPTYLWLSQRRLDDAALAFSQGNCRAAARSAASSISVLGIRPEPYEILSYCDIRAGRPRLAIAMIDKAISLDPDNWNYVYGLALMRAAAGLDPRAAARQALSLDPREPLVQDAWKTFSTDAPSQWQKDGMAIASRFTSL
jgi:O-antigen ligase